MARALVLVIGIFFLLPICSASSWTLAAHKGLETRDGIVYESICPQVRNTQKAPDEIYNLKNPLEATPENIFIGVCSSRVKRPRLQLAIRKRSRFLLNRSGCQWFNRQVLAFG